MSKSVTLMQRITARNIMHSVRNQMSRTDAAELFGIKPIYVTLIEHNTLGRHRITDEQVYLAPSIAVLKVIEWGKKNGKI